MFWDRASTELWAHLWIYWLARVPQRPVYCHLLVSTPCTWVVGIELLSPCFGDKPFILPTETSLQTPFYSFSSIFITGKEPSQGEECVTLKMCFQQKCIASAVLKGLVSGNCDHESKQKKNTRQSTNCGLQFLFNRISQTPGTGGYPRGALGQLAYLRNCEKTWGLLLSRPGMLSTLSPLPMGKRLPNTPLNFFMLVSLCGIYTCSCSFCLHAWRLEEPHVIYLSVDVYFLLYLYTFYTCNRSSFPGDDFPKVIEHHTLPSFWNLISN